MQWHIEEHEQYTEWFEVQEEELQDEISVDRKLLTLDPPTP
jgi:hypothetical protein